MGADWERTTLRSLAEQMVSHVPAGQIAVAGPDVVIASRKGLALSMALYELATNALKYGALSVEGGRVDLGWTLAEPVAGDGDGDGDGQTISMTWVEHGGPPAVEPQETGFGSFVIDRALALETQGSVKIDWSENGLRWRLDMPLAAEWETG